MVIVLFRSDRKDNKVPRKIEMPSVSPDQVHPTMNIRLCTEEKITVLAQDLCLCPNALSQDVIQRLQTDIDDLPEDFWQQWNKGNHWALRDAKRWRKHLDSFWDVQKQLGNRFSMRIRAARINRFLDGADLKLFHQDASALVPAVAKQQNTSLVLSLGATRSIYFYEMHTSNTVSIEVSHGMVYAFGDKINVDWAHGIPTSSVRDPRISLAFWGWTER